MATDLVKCRSRLGAGWLRALRKRKLIEDLQRGPTKGTYWGITTEIGNYGLADPLTQDSDRTRRLQRIRTRLNQFSSEEQGQLMNWGYALADAALRRWVMPGVAIARGNFPDGNWPV